MKYSAEQIGNNIKKEREKLGLTQDQLGAKLNFSSGKQISIYERGKGKERIIPPLDILLNMCEIFNCELGYLLGEESYSQKTQIMTQIEEMTGLDAETIFGIVRYTGQKKDSFHFGYEHVRARALFKSIILAKQAEQVFEELFDIDDEYEGYMKKKEALLKDFDEETIKMAKECMFSKTDYLNDDNAERLPKEVYEAMIKLEQQIDNKYDFDYKLRFHKFEAYEAFRRLLDELFPE